MTRSAWWTGPQGRFVTVAVVVTLVVQLLRTLAMRGDGALVAGVLVLAAAWFFARRLLGQELRQLADRPEVALPVLALILLGLPWVLVSQALVELGWLRLAFAWGVGFQVVQLVLVCLQVAILVEVCATGRADIAAGWARLWRWRGRVAVAWFIYVVGMGLIGGVSLVLIPVFGVGFVLGSIASVVWGVIGITLLPVALMAPPGLWARHAVPLALTLGMRRGEAWQGAVLVHALLMGLVAFGRSGRTVSMSVSAYASPWIPLESGWTTVGDIPEIPVMGFLISLVLAEYGLALLLRVTRIVAGPQGVAAVIDEFVPSAGNAAVGDP